MLLFIICSSQDDVRSRSDTQQTFVSGWAYPVWDGTQWVYVADPSTAAGSRSSQAASSAHETSFHASNGSFHTQYTGPIGKYNIPPPPPRSLALRSSLQNYGRQYHCRDRTSGEVYIFCFEIHFIHNSCRKDVSKYVH